jgi:hypothetical protein
VDTLTIIEEMMNVKDRPQTVSKNDNHKNGCSAEKVNQKESMPLKQK